MSPTIQARSGLRRRRRVTLLAAVLASAVTVSGCLQEGASGGGSGGGGSAEGVPPDATKQEYAAALEDLEPETIKMQSFSSAGTEESAAFETYAKELEEWSGEKSLSPAGGEARSGLEMGLRSPADVVPLWSGEAVEK